MLKPPSSSAASPVSIEPPLHTAPVFTTLATSITSFVSMSSKPSVPPSDSACADASPASVKPKSAIAAVIVGASLAPLIVIFTVFSVPSEVRTTTLSVSVSSAFSARTVASATSSV